MNIFSISLTVGLKSKKIFLLLGGLILFSLFIYNSNFSAVAGGMTSLNFYLIIAVVVINLLTPLFKTVRWKLLLSIYGTHANRFKLFSSVSAGFFLGLVTPGTLGEFGRVLTINLNKTEGIATVLYEKTFDMLVLLVIAITGVILNWYGYITSLVLLSVVWSLFFIFLYCIPKLNSLVIANSRLLSKLGRMSGKNLNLLLIHSICKLSREKNVNYFSSLISFLLWVLPGVQFYLICRMIDIKIDIKILLLCFFGPYFIGVISFIPFGFGIFDFSTAGLMNKIFQVSPELSTSSVLLYRLVVTLPLVIWGFGCYFFRVIKK